MHFSSFVLIFFFGLSSQMELVVGNTMKEDLHILDFVKKYQLTTD